MQGYVKLYRKLLENPIFQNEKLLKVFIWCLLKATHKEHEQLVGLQRATLQPGQFIYGRTKASAELNIKPSTLNDIVEILKQMKMINIKPNNKYSVVTVVNWALYQSEDEQTDNKPTTNRQQTDTNKNDKNDKNDSLKDLRIRFDQFWSSYPKKKSKGDALKAWLTIKPSEQLLAEMLTALERAKTSVDWKKEKGQFIPYPATWLRRECWLDTYEMDKPEPNKSKFADIYQS